MTSRLRRKRQTIVRSTPATKGPKWAGLLAAAIILLGPALAAADDTRAPRIPVSTVSYSIGMNGSRLKWLPFQQGKSAGEGQVVATQYAADAAAGAPAELARPSAADALADPFADRQPKPLPDAPAKRLNDEILEGPTAEPVLVGGLPEFPAEESAAVDDAQAIAVEAESSAIGEPPAAMEGPVPADKTTMPLPGEGKPKTGGAKVPSIEESLAQGRPTGEGPCPKPTDKEYFTPIDQLSDDISVRTDKDKPLGERAFPTECSLGNRTFDMSLRPSTWAPTLFTWKASGLCHKPLYFEDVGLERYGHSWGPLLQPVMSGAHFFITIPALPYAMGLCPPCECQYSLGYYRPGSCAPYLLDPFPYSVRAGLVEGGVATGLTFLLIP